MNTRIHAGLAILAVSSAAGFAQAQFLPGSQYASGLLHDPVGAVSGMSVQGRKLTACCLGSSGQDGVEVNLRSSRGGSIDVDLAEASLIPGAELRIRRKGWDGLIYGNHRLVSHGGGGGGGGAGGCEFNETADYSAMSATAVRWVLRYSSSSYISEGIVQGPVLSYTSHWGGTLILTGGSLAFHCSSGIDGGMGSGPGGSTDATRYALKFFKSTVAGRAAGPTISGLSSIPFDDVESIEFEPVLPVGTPPPAGIQSMIVTGSGFPMLTVARASLSSYGVECWGLGQAYLYDGCDMPPPLACAPPDDNLYVANIGSSGQDGVSIDLGGHATSASLRSKRCPDCPPGHITLIKFHDDAGAERMSSSVTEDALSGQEQVAFDFSPSGSPSFVATFLDNNNAPVAVLELPNGFPIGPIGDPTCTAFRYHKWRWTDSDRSFSYASCDSTIGYTVGSTQLAAARFIVRPVNDPPVAAAMRRATLTVTGGSLVVQDVSVLRSIPCPSDFNGAGGVSVQDIYDFLSAWNLGQPSADYNHQSGVSVQDIYDFLGDWNGGC